MKSVIHVVFLSLIYFSDAARILAVFPVPSTSHQNVLRILTHELARRGHDVMIITPDPVYLKGQSPTNIAEINTHNVSYRLWQEEFISKTDGKQETLHQVEIMLNTFTSIFDQVLNNSEVKNLISDNNKKIDLLLLDARVRSCLVFSHIYKAPVILISLFGAFPGDFEIFGAPTHPYLYPGILRRKHYDLSFWDTLREIYNFHLMVEMMERHEKIVENMLKKHFDNVPTLFELKENVGMLFLNVDPAYDGIRPVPPSIIYIGGVYQKPQKELSLDLKSYLDSSKNGVIYISFGTDVTTLLTPEKIQTIIEVFSQLPYNVLWKWDKDRLPEITENIRISKWLPQSDLLRHPNIKLFITEAGSKSTEEAIAAGVPMIGIPILRDQWYNAERYVHLKLGLKLDIHQFTEEEFRSAINTVILDDTYRRNVVKLRELIIDQREQPLKRAIYWMDHLINYGNAKHLRSLAANVPKSDHLDVKLFLLIVLAVLLTLTFIINLSLYFAYIFLYNIRALLETLLLRN